MMQNPVIYLQSQASIFLTHAAGWPGLVPGFSLGFFLLHMSLSSLDQQLSMVRSSHGK